MSVVSEKDTAEVRQNLRPLDRRRSQASVRSGASSEILSSAFHPYEIRGPYNDYKSIVYNDRSTAALDEELNDNPSTALCFGSWTIEYEESREQSMTIPTSPIQCLLVVIEKDTLLMLDLMNRSLDELALDILDDLKLQNHLVQWRRILAQLDHEMNELTASLPKVTALLERILSVQYVQSNQSFDFQSCHEQIATLRQKLTRSTTSFVGAISILESKRAIAEAESVTKLTELAFFFIPLTFSASIFSMQVKELTSDQPSISAFFALAVLISVGLYALRLVIRSSLVIEPRLKIMKQIRDFASLPQGSPVASRVILRWAWSVIGPTNLRQNLVFSSSVASLLLSTALLAALWSGTTVRSMKVAVTVCLCLLVASLGLGFLVVKLTPGRRSRSRL